jgi:REP element-mobilizing transposase RayT
MPRAARIEYPGAIYHVMNRGDHREEACGKTDWQVHAYCLMNNHFHLVEKMRIPAGREDLENDLERRRAQHLTGEVCVAKLKIQPDRQNEFNLA